jgi:hypothetical protein
MIRLFVSISIATVCFKANCQELSFVQGKPIKATLSILLEMDDLRTRFVYLIKDGESFQLVHNSTKYIREDNGKYKIKRAYKIGDVKLKNELDRFINVSLASGEKIIIEEYSSIERSKVLWRIEKVVP